MLLKRGNDRGQVTIFIILGIVIVVGAILFFVFRESLFSQGNIPKDIQPAYDTFLSCIEESTLLGVEVLESQGGRIELPNFEAGSTYMPFSNMLNFLGNPIPYWYYVSGNNIEKEFIPTTNSMENELAIFIEQKIKQCKLDNFYKQGFQFYMGEPNADVSITQNSVEVNLRMPLSIDFANDTAIINNHNVIVNSKLGELYDSAIKVYNYEQQNLFLEDYTIDILRLYAPVDGVELTCSPKVWNAVQIFNELMQAIQNNLLSLRNKNGDYTLVDKKNKYFVLDLGVDSDVRFLTSPNWTNSFEVTPSIGSSLVATPVGNQAGLGIIGFCYVPYHFVYNLKYPVLVQLTSGNEIFQFPLAVILQGNNPREALETNFFNSPRSEVCDFKNTKMNVLVYDNQLNLISSELSYDCGGTSCDIGQSNLVSGYNLNFPQCINGILKARAEGYVESSKIISSVDSDTVEMVLNKLYPLELNLRLGAAQYSGDAVVSFTSSDYSTTVSYPSTKIVELAEGQYEIRVYVYRNSSLVIPSTTKTQCVDSPKSGIAGLFGLTEEKCFDLEFPRQIVSNALAGGGKQNYYVLESELASATLLDITASALPTPTTLEKLQDNYILFEENGLEVKFK
jgi:hypothetical protein